MNNLKMIFKNSKKIISLYSILNIALLIIFIILYISPFNVRNVKDYKIYYLFNSLFFLFLLLNLPQSITWIFQFLFKKVIKPPVISWLGLISAISLSLVILYGTLFGSLQTSVKHCELTFNNLPEEFDNYSIVHFSDLHLGGIFFTKYYLNNFIENITEAQPDIIVFTGDLVNNFATETNNHIMHLKKISAVAKTYSILGNHDYGDYSNWKNYENKKQNFENIIFAHSDAGFKLLKNEHIIINRGNDSIYIAGVENWGHPPFPQYANLKKAVGEIPQNAFTILLTHDPAHWETVLSEYPEINLTLSGHTHGMQWGIKLAGIPYSAAWFARKNWGGIYNENESILYVNTGLGNVLFPWRIDMPGEITIITLKRSKVN